MKKPKLTKEEKAEIRKEDKQWKDFIRRMKAKGALIEETYPLTQKIITDES